MLRFNVVTALGLLPPQLTSRRQRQLEFVILQDQTRRGPCAAAVPNVCAISLKQAPHSLLTAPNLRHVQVLRFLSRRPWKNWSQSNQPRPAVSSSFRWR